MGLEKTLEFQGVLHFLPWPSHQFDLKAPITRQKMFDTARIKVVRVSKNYIHYSFTSHFFYRAKRCEIMIWYG